MASELNPSSTSVRVVVVDGEDEQVSVATSHCFVSMLTSVTVPPADFPKIDSEKEDFNLNFDFSPSLDDIGSCGDYHSKAVLMAMWKEHNKTQQRKLEPKPAQLVSESIDHLEATRDQKISNSFTSLPPQLKRPRTLSWDPNQQSTQESTHITALPEDILLHIMRNLQAKDLCAVACVNKRLHEVTSEDTLWKAQCKKFWPQSSTPKGMTWKNLFQSIRSVELTWQQADGLRVARQSLGVVDQEGHRHCEDVVFFRVDVENSVIATISRQGLVRTWNTNSLSLLHTIVLPDNQTPCRLAVAGGLVAVGTFTGSLFVYQLAKAELIRRMEHSPDTRNVWGVFLTRDRLLLTGTHTINIWNPLSGSLLHTHGCSTPDQPADNIFFLVSHKGTLFTAHNSGCVNAWDLESGQFIRTMRGHSQRCTRVCIQRSSGEDVLVSSSFDGTVCMWDLQTGRCLDVACVGVPIIGLAAGDCGPEWLVIVTLAGDKCNSAQLWSCGSKSFRKVAEIPHQARYAMTTSPSCWFDGTRLFYNHESELPGISGELSIVCAK